MQQPLNAGTMDESYTKKARNIVLQLLDTLSTDDFIKVLSFSGDSSNVQPILNDSFVSFIFAPVHESTLMSFTIHESWQPRVILTKPVVWCLHCFMGTLQHVQIFVVIYLQTQVVYNDTNGNPLLNDLKAFLLSNESGVNKETLDPNATAMSNAINTSISQLTVNSVIPARYLKVSHFVIFNFPVFMTTNNHFNHRSKSKILESQTSAHHL